MEQEHFGTLLRDARLRRDLAVRDIAEKTKVAPSTLESLEAGDLDGLPPSVFVRGFIRSYAKAMGIDDSEPLLQFDRAVEAKRRAEEARYTQPIVASGASRSSLSASSVTEESGLHPRRGIGLAVFVIIVLVIATMAWSLVLRQPPESGEALSRLGGLAPASALPIATHFDPSV